MSGPGPGRFSPVICKLEKGKNVAVGICPEARAVDYAVGVGGSGRKGRGGSATSSMGKEGKEEILRSVSVQWQMSRTVGSEKRERGKAKRGTGSNN